MSQGKPRKAYLLEEAKKNHKSLDSYSKKKCTYETGETSGLDCQCEKCAKIRDKLFQGEKSEYSSDYW